MKRFIKKSLALLLAIILLFSVTPISLANQAVKYLNYYVINGGTGVGVSREYPAGSVTDIITLINNNSASLTANDTVVINILERSDWNSAPDGGIHNMTYIGSSINSVTPKLIIQGDPESANKVHLAFGQYTNNESERNLNINNDVTFKNLVLTSTGRDSLIYLNGNGLYTDNDVTFANAYGWNGGTLSETYAPRIVATAYISSDTYNSQEIEIKSPLASGGNIHIPSNCYANLTYSEEFNLTLDNPEIGKKSPFIIYFAGHHENYQKSYYLNTLNINVKNANNIRFLSGASINENQYLNIISGLQLMINKNTYYNTLDLTEFLCIDDSTPLFVLINDSGIDDALSFTKKAGTYKVKNGYIITAINNSTGEKFISSNYSLTLPAGTYTFTAQKETDNSINFYVQSNGTGNGISEQTPAPSVAAVFETIAASPLDENDVAIINVTDLSDWNTAPVNDIHNMANIDNINVPVSPKIIIRTNPKSDAKAHLAYKKNTSAESARNLTLKNSITFENIVLVGTCRDSWINLNGNDIHFKDTVDFADAYLWTGGQLSIKGYPKMDITQYIADGSYKAQTINISAPFVNGGRIAIPGICFTPVTYTEDLNIVLDNENIGKNSPFIISFAGGHENTVTSNFNKNLNIYIKNAAKVNFISGAHQNGNQFVNVKGALQLILNASTIYNTTDIASIPSIKNPDNVYVIKNATNDDNIITFSNTAGTYNVTEEVYAVNSDGVTVVSNEGKLILSSGEWVVYKYLKNKSGTNNYYVMNGGTGNGKTANTPAPSVAEVIKTINADGLTTGDTATVYLIQRYDHNMTPTNKNHYKAYWSKDGSVPPSHKARIIVTSYNLTDFTHLTFTDNLSNVNSALNLSGPTTFKALYIVSQSGGANKGIVANGNDFSVERDISFGSISSNNATTSYSYGDNFNLTNGSLNTYTNPINIKYSHPTIANSSLYIGNRSNTTLLSTFKEDVNITFDNTSLGSHETINYPLSFSGNSYFEKNLNIHFKNADKIVFNAPQNASVKANGGVQIIADSPTRLLSDINNLSCFKDGTKVWTLTLDSSAKDSLTFTKTAGTFAITKDIVLLATNESGDTVSSKDRKLTLPDGKWKVIKKNVIHYGDSNADGKLNIKDLVNLKKRIAFNQSAYLSADINSDNAVNSEDLILLKKHFLGVNVIKWEKYDIELEITPDMHSASDDAAAELKEKISSSKDTIIPKGTVYYVAIDSNYYNNGNSPETAIPMEKLRNITLNSGDTVLFKRGDIFRITKALPTVSGVSYGAYGSGPKPQIIGSARDYADPDIWSSDDGIIWSTQIMYGLDVCHIVFDEGTSSGFKKQNLEQLENDGDFYFDKSTGKLYLKLNQHNPGFYFSSIEMTNLNDSVFKISGYSQNGLVGNINIENLCIKYTHNGMGFNFAQNINVQYCEFHWMGGGWWNESVGTRWGGGVGGWDILHTANISNNYFYQNFDSPLTFQGSNYNDYTNLTFQNNLIEYSSMNFEFWGNDNNNTTSTSNDADATFKNIDVSKNIFRFGGYSYSGIQRVGKSDQAFILAWFYKFDEHQIENFNITDNIFDTANCNFFYGPNCLHLVNIENNTYYQQAGSEFTVARNNGFYSEDYESFKIAIEAVDKNPKHIEWIE